MNKQKTPVKGSCHCGRVKYEVMVSRQIVAHRCNCSICSQSGFVGLIVPAKDFNILAGEGQLSEYRFNTGVARHLFCSHCGIKSFYVPRSNPDGFSVNINCLKLPRGVELTIEEFDGQHWEKHAGALAQLSQGN